MIEREYYYSYNNVVVSGIPEKKGNSRLIGSKKQQQINNDNVNDNPFMSNGYPGQPTLIQTADGYTESNGASSSVTRPRVRSKWAKGGRTIPNPEDRKRAEVIDDISSNFRDLKTNNATWLVDYRDSTQE